MPRVPELPSLLTFPCPRAYGHSGALDYKELEKALRFLSEKPLARIKGWGETSAKNLFEAIEEKKEIPLARLIFGLGIRHVGEAASSLIALHYGDWDNFEAAMAEARGLDGPAGVLAGHVRQSQDRLFLDGSRQSFALLQGYR